MSCLDSNSNSNSNSESDQTIRLPDEILFLMLSALPYTSVATTRFVCKRLHSLWNTVSHSSGPINGLDRVINTFLDGINNSDPFKHPWRLSYTYGNQSVLRASVASNWQLHLIFHRPEKTDGLFHLSLHTPTTNVTECEPDVNSFYVKRLHLATVTSHAISNVLSTVFSSFRYLECLHMEGCRMNTLFVSVPKLRELTILDCVLLKSVRVIAPNLEVFKFRGRRPWFLGKGLDSTKLVEAMLDFRSGSQSKYIGSRLNLVVLALKEIQCVTLCRATIEEFITSEQYRLCEKIKLQKLKELWWIDNSVDNQRTNVLLSFLRNCPMLEKLFITIDPIKSSWSRSAVKCFDRPVKYTGLSRLEFVKIDGCVDEETEIILAKSIANCASMNPLIISRTNDHGEYKKYVKVELEKPVRSGFHGCESKMKYSFMPLVAGEERKMAGLNHVHMAI